METTMRAAAALLSGHDPLVVEGNSLLRKRRQLVMRLACVLMAGGSLVSCGQGDRSSSGAKAGTTVEDDAQAVANAEYAERVPDAGAFAGGDYATSWETVEDFADADLVAVVEVTSERPLELQRRGLAPTEPGLMLRELTLEPMEVIAGNKRTVKIDAYGWSVEPDGTSHPVTGEGTRLEVGDTVLVALGAPVGNQPYWSLLGGDSALFLAGGEVVDTGRRKPVIAELERLTEADLLDRIEHAVS
jgi:hypothetical protein